jgi:predicted DNA-binding protein
MKENKVVTISAQIPAELEKALIKLCESEERSKSYFIKKALEKLIQEKFKEVGSSVKKTKVN